MNMYDIIKHKRDGQELASSELEFWLNGCVAGEIPDYQTTALLMAIFLNGLTEQETFILTGLMVHSGDILDLSSIDGVTIDKHSTGGVGDKTTLVLGPMLSAAGLKFAKISGRGLGHTGGTLDKLESITGFTVDLSPEDFLSQVDRAGIAVVGQSERLVPADKRLYALRDVTATVDSIPLIAASIMSKKLAVGADIILLDVKYGSGAFLPTPEAAVRLADVMIKIGEHFGRKTAAVISSMDSPLGRAVGNSLEIEEVCATLSGEGPEDLTELCLILAAEGIYQSGLRESRQRSFALANRTLHGQRAWRQFGRLVQEQGGDWSSIKKTQDLNSAPMNITIGAESQGYISYIDAMAVGLAARDLGAGRRVLGEAIDHQAGIYLHKQIGDFVHEGEAVATLYGHDLIQTTEIGSRLMTALTIVDQPPTVKPVVYGIMDRNGFIPYERSLYIE